MPALQTYVVEEFGGLNVRDDPQQIGAGAAAVSRNIVPGSGLMRTRPGYDIHVARADTNSFTFLYALPDANRILAGFGGTDLVVYDATGASVSTAAPGNVRSATNIATLAQSAGTYVGIEGGVAARFVSTAGAISAPAFTGHTPSQGILGTTPKSFRLISTDGLHTVWFSDSGDPLTFNVDNNVPLWPNDGETIQWIATWKDMVFVFKRTKFAVFYAENVDNDGTLIFEYRGVFNIPALDFPNGKSVAVGRDGVYYLSRTGVYVTTGDAPQRVSGVLDPLFLTIPDGPVVGTSPGGKPDYTLTVSYPWLHYDQDFLYVCYPGNSLTTASPYMAVLDLRRDMWSQWDMSYDASGAGITALISQPFSTTTSTRKELIAATPYVNFPTATPDIRSTISVFNNTDGIDRTRRTNGADQTAALAWEFTSGYYDLSTPGEKRIRYTDVYGSDASSGSGFAILDVNTLGGRTPSAYSGSLLTLGTAPDIDRYRRNSAGKTARMFRHALTGVGATVITRLEHRYTTSGSR